MFNLTPLLSARPGLLLAGALFIGSIACPTAHADEITAQPRRKPDVKAWKTNRAEGQKALEQKHYTEAEAFFKAALDEAMNFDAGDERLADSLLDLGTFRANQRNFTAAEPLLRQAAEIRHGDPHPEFEINCLYRLAVVSHALGHYDESAKAYLRIETLESRKLGPNHPLVVEDRFSLAKVYFDQGDYAQAEPLLKRCAALFENPASRVSFRKGETAAYGMSTYRRTFHPDYVNALEALSRLNRIYLLQNRLPEAEAGLKDSLKLVDEYAGKGEPALPEALHSLSAFYISTTNYAAADSILQRLITIQEKSLGATNEATLASQATLAGVCEQENKPAEAEALYQKIVVMDDTIYGPDSRESAVALANLAKICVVRGQYEQAELLYRRQFVHTEKYQGDGVALTPILADQAIIYSKLGRDAELEAVYRRQIVVYEKMLGANSPALVKPLKDCALVLRREKHDAEAASFEARAQTIQGAQVK